MAFTIPLGIFGLLNVLLAVNSAKILIVFNYLGKSHYFQGRALGHGLARAGHEVTMISAHQDNQPVKGYKEIVLDGITKNLGSELPKMSRSLIKLPKMPMVYVRLKFHPICLMYTERTLSHPKFQALLNSNQTFDVVILEDVLNVALRALSWHFKAPLIICSPYPAMANIHIMSGNSVPPSYVSNVFMGNSHFMTFWQRSMNTFMYIFEVLFHYFLVDPAHETLKRKYFPKCPDIKAIDKNISLFLINNHESISSAIPSVPNMINIMGFHLKEENTLPKELQNFMDTADEGVILFSFGSFLNASDLNPHTKKAFVNALGKLKQKVLWKSDEDNFPGKPDNIKLSKWLPQEDILAHPNCKLFISHAGLLSTIETVYHGVPVLAFPLFADQDLNAIRAAEMGMGHMLILHDVTEEKLDYSLHELLHNDNYRQNAKKRSSFIRDRPMKPMDYAVYWVEYVIRHKDLSHMRVASLELTWYQYFLIDVILVWSIAFLSIIFLVYYVFKLLICKFCIQRKKIKTN